MGLLFLFVSIFIAMTFVFVAAVFAIVFGTIVYRAVAGVAECSRNNSLPVLEEPACVVSRRTELRGRISAYYATFEMKTGERFEFSFSGPAYGLLVEGDQGTLTYQGTRYHGFQRRV